MEMLAAQAAHREDSSIPGDEELIISDKKMSAQEKSSLLSKTLHMAASNGDIERVKRLVGGKASQFIDVDAADEEGTAPLIYASCFVGPLITSGRYADTIRATTKSYRRFSTQELPLTAKIATNGPRLCGRWRIGIKTLPKFC